MNQYLHGMNLNLSGKNALVCGSSRGIGKASAVELAKLGANITLVSRSEDVMIDALHDLEKSQGQQHDYLVMDLSKPEDVRKKVTGLIAQKSIQILVNNTGGPPPGKIQQADVEAFMDAFQQHLVANHILTKAIIPSMISSDYGRIINIISTSVKQPLDGLGVSNTIRGAVGNWSKTFANEIGPHGITMNNVLPGATATERLAQIINSKAQKTGMSVEDVEEKMKSSIPLRRFGKPEEIGAAVAFLASPAAAYISGTNVVVDGGRTKSL